MPVMQSKPRSSSIDGVATAWAKLRIHCGSNPLNMLFGFRQRETKPRPLLRFKPPCIRTVLSRTIRDSSTLSMALLARFLCSPPLLPPQVTALSPTLPSAPVLMLLLCRLLAKEVLSLVLLRSLLWVWMVSLRLPYMLTCSSLLHRLSPSLGLLRCAPTLLALCSSTLRLLWLATPTPAHPTI